MKMAELLPLRVYPFIKSYFKPDVTLFSDGLFPYPLSQSGVVGWCDGAG